MQHYADNFIPVIPDTNICHTKEHPFCGDPTCICYEDEDAITELAQAVREGLLAPEDATQIIKGKTV